MEQQKQQLEQQMLAAVIPNTSVMPPTSVGQQQQQQQQKNIPSLMAQKVAMPIMDDNDHFSNQSTQQNIDNNALYANTTGNNFFIPDLSKPPPGFLSGNTNNMTQMPALMQQQTQFPSINSNIPVNQNLNNPPPNLMPAADMLGNINNLNVDLLNVNAALQLVQQQQQLQQVPQTHHQQIISYDQQQQQPPTMTSSTSGMGSDDECVPPPPSLQLEQEPEQIPSAAYYDLPAGLMVPLIRLEDYRYKPLDPVDIRLPPPAPQNERLTNALAAFYSLPTHDRPRDKYVNLIFISIRDHF